MNNLGLPLLFKLKKNSKTVGYEKHEKSLYLNSLIIMHTENDKKWDEEDNEITTYDGENYIWHDEKYQFTGYYDKNENKIYFGDILKVSHDDEFKYQMIIKNGKIIAEGIQQGRVFDVDMFKEMELIEE